MMTDADVRAAIAREFAVAEKARGAGNEGMTRVCARRAVGLAATAWLARHAHPGWPGDALRQIQRIAEAEEFPVDVRSAAARLAARVTAEFAPSRAGDPLQDGRIVIAHLLP
jgi:hypothetical protein